jgi:hypothetical protein
MSLPVYQQINISGQSFEELAMNLNPDINLRHPVAFNLKALDLDHQRETIGLIENYFAEQNLSFKFPYPIFVVSDHEPSICRLPLVKEVGELPKFFAQRESKMNVKESHLAGKNKLLQQEVKNSDASSNQKNIECYAEDHRKIHELDVEIQFYREIYKKIMKGQSS